MKDTLCPFSKPIIGNWCQCQHANLAERCAGKMVCKQADKYLTECRSLVEIFKEKSRFVLGINQQQNELTHMQLMKIRCGGLRGMQRVLSNNSNIPNVLDIMRISTEHYGSVNEFPFNEIIRDIKAFSHRKKKE